MSETILRLLAEELTAIRVTCPNKSCGAILEMKLNKLPENKVEIKIVVPEIKM